MKVSLYDSKVCAVNVSDVRCFKARTVDCVVTCYCVLVELYKSVMFEVRANISQGHCLATDSAE